MPIAAIPKSVLLSTVKAYRAAGCSSTACAKNLGFAKSTVTSRLEMARRAGIEVPAPIATLTGKTAPDAGRLKKENEALRYQIERMSKAKPFVPVKIVKRPGKDDIVRVIMPDSHGAHADPMAMSLFLAGVKALCPDQIVMLGDHIDCGGFLAEHNVLGYVAEMDYSYADDVEACKSHLDLLREAAPSAVIDYLEGNHEDRVERWCVTQALRSSRDADLLRRAISPEFLLDLKGRGINYFRRSEKFDGISIPGAIKRGKTIFVHQPPHGDPKKTVFRFGCPVVHGHDHRSHQHVTSTVAAGEISVTNFGCLAQRQMLWHHSNPSEHTHGFGVDFESRSGHFLRLTIPIINGQSLLDHILRSTVK